MIEKTNQFSIIYTEHSSERVNLKKPILSLSKHIELNPNLVLN